MRPFLSILVLLVGLSVPLNLALSQTKLDTSDQVRRVREALRDQMSSVRLIYGVRAKCTNSFPQIGDGLTYNCSAEDRSYPGGIVSVFSMSLSFATGDVSFKLMDTDVVTKLVGYPADTRAIEVSCRRKKPCIKWSWHGLNPKNPYSHIGTTEQIDAMVMPFADDNLRKETIALLSAIADAQSRTDL